MNVNIRQLVYKFQDMEQQFKTKSNISSKLLEHHQQSNMSDYITERLLSTHSPRLYFEGLEVNRGVGGGGGGGGFGGGGGGGEEVLGLEVLLGILGGGVPPGSPNPDPNSDQKMPFSTPILRPDL